MDLFGGHWKDHPAKIAANCAKVIAPDDIFLLPGDLSWAMKRKEADEDLRFIAALPGIKVMCKGNHDYWWDSDRPLKFEGLHGPTYISDDGEIGVAGTRGWTPIYADLSPGEREKGERTILKEASRLRKRLEAIKDCKIKYAMIHHPPLPDFAKILIEYEVNAVVYGHIHIGGSDEPLPQLWNGMRCICVSSDRMRFTPYLLDAIDSSV
jgi:predicted phosphohydrolase